MSDDMDSAVDRLRATPPGGDDANPYDGVDVSELPAWWRDAIEEFEAYGMRPYRPPRFTDGEYVPEVVAQLESELGVSVYVMGINVTVGDDWSIVVDGEHVSPVGRRRDTAGYTVFELERSEFETIVREAVAQT